MIIALSNGEKVDVHPVPPFAMANIEASNSIPANLDGDALEAAIHSREMLMRDAAWLLALPDVVVPEGWEFPAPLRFAGVYPRENEMYGLKLDYIEYGLLLTPADVEAVQRVMFGAALTEDEIGAAEETFPTDGGRTTYPLSAEG